MAKALSVSDKEWQARDDANTLASAEEIMQDSKRMKAAASQAEKMAADRQKAADSLKKIAQKGKGPKTVPKVQKKPAPLKAKGKRKSAAKK
jgi:hypothetical protein